MDGEEEGRILQDVEGRQKGEEILPLTGRGGIGFSEHLHLDWGFQVSIPKKK